MSDPENLDLKARLRRDALARRDALDAERRAEASRRIAERALALPELSERSPVAVYWPMRSEVDPRAIMHGLHGRGQAVALPVVARPHMRFRLWAPGDRLVGRGFGVSEPIDEAPEAFPQALLVPLACFDRRGGRIGYGKGHYDRAIAALSARQRVLAVGLAFSVQETTDVPVEAHDRRLTIIVTEQGIVRVGSG